MSRLKFRAWDKHHRVFIDQRKFCIRFDGEIVTLDNSGHWSTQNPADFHIVQFAGLKDKNGEDVYEGDITKHENRDIPDVVCWDGLPLHHCWCAIPVNKYEQFKRYQETGEGVHPVETDCVESLTGEVPEVIGNIYESPELLRGSHE